MRGGGHHLAKMHLVTIALLLALAAFGAYSLGIVPVALAVAVIACVAVEFALVKVGGHRFRFPLSAVITGLIIGSVAPINASLLLVIVAALIAELTKFFLKAKARNVFNPAAVGLLVALVAFGAGDEWWAASSLHVYRVLVPLAALLIISAYEARRLPLALVATAAITVGIAALSAVGPLASLLALNYYFVFLMVADPKTSPNKVSGQVQYGIGIAAFVLVLMFARVPYPLLAALLLANILYAGFRVLYRHGAQARVSAPVATP
jgi:Na+-translocating ferredoxin:NAD+ oxidoreductase RnfD subunit